jgi:hypothetical protein
MGTPPKRRKTMIPAIPTGYHSVSPMILFRDAGRAIDFY